MGTFEIKIEAVLNNKLDEGFFKTSDDRLENAVSCACTSLKSIFSEHDPDVEVVFDLTRSNIAHYKIKLNNNDSFSKNAKENLELVRSSFKDNKYSYYSEFLIVNYIKT